MGMAAPEAAAGRGAGGTLEPAVGGRGTSWGVCALHRVRTSSPRCASRSRRYCSGARRHAIRPRGIRGHVSADAKVHFPRAPLPANHAPDRPVHGLRRARILENGRTGVRPLPLESIQNRAGEGCAVTRAGRHARGSSRAHFVWHFGEAPQRVPHHLLVPRSPQSVGAKKGSLGAVPCAMGRSRPRALGAVSRRRVHTMRTVVRRAVLARVPKAAATVCAVPGSCLVSIG